MAKKKEQYPDHAENIIALKRIEGQVRGIQRMIEQRRYCVDILTQMYSIVGALMRVEDKIMQKHLSGCVTKSFQGKSKLAKQKEIDGVVTLVKKFRRKS